MLILFIVCGLSVIFILKYVFGGSEPNPFGKDCREPLKEKVYDKKEKNKVLKQGESINDIFDRYRNVNQHKRIYH